ncbi:hypothetical protein DSLASN_27220 [Desulfoluna limicola]|uniref:Glycosyltransferase 2-like domain-containing protein n=1 Tax=Desulfoluna limicola TaxID=2810562 RepID=A0ABM7PIS8_9BACT|nr:glycosyltransferase [Desulfoluna limicola]BCS97090.1 hypothetical protein DSLASN_27220 [Desulfoluna limicola]
MDPRVSVVIPCYNRESYIEETIHSVLKQTYQHIEIIAVDDGSTDETRKILEKFGHRVLLLEHPDRANKGQSASINLGLSVATGKYIAILDSDDLFAPNKISLQVACLESHPDVGVVYGNGWYIDQKGHKLHSILGRDHKETNDPARMLLTCHFNIPSNSLVRKTVYDTVGGFDESMRSAQDHDMGIRIMEVTKAAYIDHILWYYRQHSDSQSGRHALRRWLTGFVILKKSCVRYDYGLRIKMKRLAVLNFRLGQCYLAEKSYDRAMVCLLKSGFFDPLRGLRVLTGLEKVGNHH